MSSSGGINRHETTPVPTTTSEADFWAVAKSSLSEFTSRLGGGGFGDLRVEGSKPHHSKGHRELFQLKELLETIQANQAKLLHLEEHPKEEIEAPNKKPAKMNANSTAAMKNVIAEATDSKFRDISIKFDDVLKRLERSEKENDYLKEQLRKVEGKAKRSAPSAGANASAALSRIDRLEEYSLQAFHELQSTINEHKKELALRGHIPDAHDQLKGRVSKLEIGTDKLRKDLEYKEFCDQLDYYRWIGGILKTKEWLLHINNRLAELQPILRSDKEEFCELSSAEDIFDHNHVLDIGEAYEDARTGKNQGQQDDHEENGCEVDDYEEDDHEGYEDEENYEEED